MRGKLVWGRGRSVRFGAALARTAAPFAGLLRGQKALKIHPEVVLSWS